MADSLEGYTPEEIAQMAATYKGLVDHPETREITLRATKKLNPNASIPEIELKDAARAAFQAERTEREKLEQQIRERDARDRIRDERQGLRDKGFSADEVAAIEKIMLDKQIPSYSTAAEFYRGQQTIAQPTPHSAESQPALTFNMPTDAMTALKGGKAGLSKFAREQAAGALEEIRAGRIKLQ